MKFTCDTQKPQEPTINWTLEVDADGDISVIGNGKRVLSICKDGSIKFWVKWDRREETIDLSKL